MRIDTSKFSSKKELFNFLVKNKQTIKAHKKAAIKHADGALTNYSIFNKNSYQIIKSNSPIPMDELGDSIKTKLIINTTNLVDSHKDLHLPGIWTKSLQENKRLLHLQEHKQGFENIISDGEDLKASTESFTFKDLGFDLIGETQALVFESNVTKDRNEFMFNQYAKGFVKEHSVGMYYVKLFLAVNDKDFSEEFEIWDKHIDSAANKDDVLEDGFFWAVTEAKAIEGSAVPLGSNFATPTLDNNIKNIESGNHSTIEPSIDTQTNNLRKHLLKNY